MWVYAKGKILLSMTPASEVTPAKPVSRNPREIEVGGCVGVCEAKELSPRLVVGTISYNQESALIVSSNFCNWNLAAQNLFLRMLGCGFTAMQGEISVWPVWQPQVLAPEKEHLLRPSLLPQKILSWEGQFSTIYFPCSVYGCAASLQEMCLESPVGALGTQPWVGTCWVTDTVWPLKGAEEKHHWVWGTRIPWLCTLRSQTVWELHYLFEVVPVWPHAPLREKESTECRSNNFCMFVRAAIEVWLCLTFI